MIDTRTAPYAAFLLRITLGALFLAHAGLKLFVSLRLELRSFSAVSACRRRSPISPWRPKFSAVSH